MISKTVLWKKEVHLKLDNSYKFVEESDLTLVYTEFTQDLENAV